MSKIIIIEGNSNDKDNIRAYMVKGEKGYSAYDLYVQNGGTLTEEQWLDAFLNAENYYTKSEIDTSQNNQNTIINKKPYYFNTAADMKNYNFVAGDMAITKGYYNENDGGNAEYTIRTKTVDDVEDNGFIHFLTNNLVAEMICNDFINIKQFGAIEDGETDDTTAFSNAINCITKKNIKNLVLNNKNYVITEKLTISSVNILGNNATILYTSSGSTEDYPLHFTGENFKIENLNFDLGDSTYLSPAIRLQNCNNVEIVNGYYTHFIDLYSNNKNIVQRNLRFTSKCGLTVRELFNYTTENILFENCLAIRNEYPDEVLWFVSSNGTIRNVKCVNCTLIHNGGSQNCVSISAYYDGSLIENINFENCIFKLNITGYNGISIGHSSSNTPGNVKKVIFKNCKFSLTCYTDNRIVCRNEKDRKEVVFDNCKINVEDSTKYGFWDCTFYNSDLNVDSLEYAFRCCNFDNCDIIAEDSNYATVGACNIINSKMSCKGLANLINVNLYGIENETKIVNTEITTVGDTVFQVSSNSGKIYLQDCKINNPVNSTVFSTVSVTSDCYYTLKNCDIVTGYSKLSNYNPNSHIYIDNLSTNNQPIAIDINDIDSNSRLAIALNTLILAPIGTGLYYRKTSDGNATGNFTLYGN